ncbi:hypothetical protein GF354_05100 [Candidatus Peregrinibacteria bacterium]|nr:hypothetical protein [Candidatus Peregrinibacteria bacterium]
MDSTVKYIGLHNPEQIDIEDLARFERQILRRNREVNNFESLLGTEFSGYDRLWAAIKTRDLFGAKYVARLLHRKITDRAKNEITMLEQNVDPLVLIRINKFLRLIFGEESFCSTTVKELNDAGINIPPDCIERYYKN